MHEGLNSYTMKVILTLIFLLLMISCTSSTSDSQQKPTEQKATTEAVEPGEPVRKVILFFGNSITAGYQLDLDEAFPALIQKKIDSSGFSYQTINAGLSGETSAGGKSRIDWVLRTVPDIFFLELGANDGLRGLPLTETKVNLQDIIDVVKKANPDVKIIVAGMMVPPNLGADYTSEFVELFPQLAEINNATYIPFLLEGVAGIPSLNLPDGIHPTPEGHQIIAGTVWDHLLPLLE